MYDFEKNVCQGFGLSMDFNRVKDVRPVDTMHNNVMQAGETFSMDGFSPCKACTKCEYYDLKCFPNRDAICLGNFGASAAPLLFSKIGHQGTD